MHDNITPGIRFYDVFKSILSSPISQYWKHIKYVDIINKIK